jgi:hypothetical protein
MTTASSPLSALSPNCYSPQTMQAIEDKQYYATDTGSTKHEDDKLVVYSVGFHRALLHITFFTKIHLIH